MEWYRGLVKPWRSSVRGRKEHFEGFEQELSGVLIVGRGPDDFEGLWLNHSL
jgi:hypothetical protein